MAEGISAEAKRLAAEKPDLWEYKLALDVLENEMRPIIQRWDGLKRRLYSAPKNRIAREDFAAWMQDRLSEAADMAVSFTTIVNEEFGAAWGTLEEPGDADEIIVTSKLYAEMCTTALAWEERVRFTTVDDFFEPVRSLLVGVGGCLIDEAKKLPAFISAIVNDPEASGTYSLHMVLDLPDKWVEQVREALQVALIRLAVRR